MKKDYKSSGVENHSADEIGSKDNSAKVDHAEKWGF